ncbi:MAG: pseudouridine synthase [Raoultibacter sp.]
MRLQKFLARAGAASRRGSENLMSAGRVRVNGQVVSELGSKVDPLVDEVMVDDVVVTLAGTPVTLMLHKPAGYVTTMSDPHARKIVAELVPTKLYPGLFPIGRLDCDTTGLLLFSTDGDLGNRLLHPKHHVTKVYEALVQGTPTPAQLDALRRGILLEDGLTAPAQAELMGSQRTDARATSRVRVGIHEGRKRQVRRMFTAINHEVITLHRERFGPLDLGDLPEGGWRQLSDGELASLWAAAGQQC